MEADCNVGSEQAEVELVDMSDGELKFYYFNIATNDSSWIPPRAFHDCKSLFARSLEHTVRLLTSLCDESAGKKSVTESNPTLRILDSSAHQLVEDHRSLAWIIILNVVSGDLIDGGEIYTELRDFISTRLDVQKKRCVALAYWDQASTLPLIICEKAMHEAIDDECSARAIGRSAAISGNRTPWGTISSCIPCPMKRIPKSGVAALMRVADITTFSAIPRFKRIG